MTKKKSFSLFRLKNSFLFKSLSQLFKPLLLKLTLSFLDEKVFYFSNSSQTLLEKLRITV